jgi:hypothetical protein
VQKPKSQPKESGLDPACFAFSIHFNRIPKTPMWVEVSAQSTICHRKEQLMDSLEKWNESVLKLITQMDKKLCMLETPSYMPKT